jgi:CheY-like chemotaxis protein
MKSALLIDDDPMWLEVLAQVLNDNGWNTERALSGDEGMRKMTANFFSAVFLDVRMPEKDGFEVYAEIRAIEKTMPVIFLTGYSNDERFNALKTERNVYINSKPATWSDIEYLIRKIEESLLVE